MRNPASLAASRRFAGDNRADLHRAAEDVDVLLVPTTVNPGRYAITVTRRAQDIYRADGIGLHIQTRYCYEYAYGEQAVLELQARAGYSIGRLVFGR